MTTFDALAPAYDADFTRSPIARHLRGRVQRRLLIRLQLGDHALELGCGTGEDAAWLAAQGVQVTATDSSPAMLDAARAKLAGTHAVVAPLDLNALPEAWAESYRGVYANFGVLNCAADLPALAQWLAGQVQTGGFALFVVMSPLCLWEMGWHGLHGEWRVACRRLRGDTSFRTATGTSALIYPAPHTLANVFKPYFRRAYVEPLGLFLPPSDVYPVIERRPRLLRTLMDVDDRLPFAPLAVFADHYLIELVRTDAEVG